MLDGTVTLSRLFYQFFQFLRRINITELFFISLQQSCTMRISFDHRTAARITLQSQ